MTTRAEKPHPNRGDQFRFVDRICDEFESSWSSGSQPSLGEYISQASYEFREELFSELLAVDIAYRRDRGDRPRAEDYLTEFAQFAELIHREFAVENTTVVETLEHALASDESVRTDEYPLLEEVGRGGMGEVYRTSDSELGRHLAVKVIRAKYMSNPHAKRRFLQEAKITGALQHPGIVPVHKLGRLADGRLFFTMKLVRGLTLDQILSPSNGKPCHSISELLEIFEKICQAVAYAHSCGVIHRDLKPGNIMIGAFGEVQVMDWGLARMKSTNADTKGGADSTFDEVVQTGMQTVVGTTLGTPAYMPPEQARGEIDDIDERADVFALGAILCVMLTGKPPFPFADADQAVMMSQRGDLSGAFARIELADPDPELARLCRECLAPDKADRPPNAGVVAQRVDAYRVGVGERLRQAELESAQAKTKAKEEQKRRRLAIALAAAVMLLILGAGSATWLHQMRQAATDDKVQVEIEEAISQQTRALANPLDEQRSRDALLAAIKARDLAMTAGASAQMIKRAHDLHSQIETENQAAQRDRRLLARLLNIHEPNEGPRFTRDERGRVNADLLPTVDEQFESAFREWGLNIADSSTENAVALLKARPPMTVFECIAALDGWAAQLRRDNGNPKRRRWLVNLANALDDAGNTTRKELREIVASSSSAGISAKSGAATEEDAIERQRLLDIAKSVDPAVESILGLNAIAQLLRQAGEDRIAIDLLRSALRVRPKEVVLFHTLASLLSKQSPPRWSEVVECYTAARTLRPELGIMLADALFDSGREAESLSLFQVLSASSSDNPNLHFRMGWRLANRDSKASEAAYRRTLELDPQHVSALNNLGLLLKRRGDIDSAIDAYQRALATDPNLTSAHVNMATAKFAKKDFEGAIEACQVAVKLSPNESAAHYALGLAQFDKGDVKAAAAAFKQATVLNPQDYRAQSNLGTAMHASGDLQGAIAAFRQATVLNPSYATAFNNLGDVLRTVGDMEGAIDALQKAIQLDEKFGPAHAALGQAMLECGRYSESAQAFQRALDVLPAKHAFRTPVNAQLKSVEKMRTLESKLSAVLLDQSKPANNEEALTLAQMCLHRKQYAGGVKLYRHVIDSDPARAEKWQNSLRYDAACCAVLASKSSPIQRSTNGGPDANAHREQAITWLRADISAMTKSVGENARVKRSVQQRVAKWLTDADLVSVRDPVAIEKLPEPHRSNWKKLWVDLKSLR